jgi:multicomponent Na+:H+ antiporter subunit B
LRIIGLILLIVAVGLFIYVSGDLPDRASTSAPANTHVSPEYIERAEEEVGVPNLVTAVLADYRGYDTLGETVVIFTAGIAVIYVLMRGRENDRPVR